MLQDTVGLLFLLSGTILSASAVINGIITPKLNLRSQASIHVQRPEIRNSREIICGGALISPEIVITAAHCVYQNNKYASSVQVRLNNFDMKRVEPFELNMTSNRIEILPSYLEDEEGTDDLAIIYLPRPVKEACTTPEGPKIARLPPTPFAALPLFRSSKAKEILTFPLTDLELETAFCHISGWGIDEDNEYPSEPRTAVVRLSVHHSKKGQVLIGEPISSRTKLCLGDSGSPVTCFIRGRNYLIGVATELSTWVPDVRVRKFNRKSAEKEKCMMYDYVIIPDLRQKLNEIQELIQRKGLNSQLLEGQEQCVYY